MNYCITTDQDGKELHRIPLAKNTKPRCGFERAANGNYYKRLKDPRCITDEEKRIELRKQREKEFMEKYGVVVIDRPKFGFSDTKVFKARIAVDPTNLQACMQNYAYDLDGGRAILKDPQLIYKLDYHGLDRRMKYAKIILDMNQKSIEIWDINNTKECPDMVILEALK